MEHLLTGLLVVVGFAFMYGMRPRRKLKHETRKAVEEGLASVDDMVAELKGEQHFDAACLQGVTQDMDGSCHVLFTSNGVARHASCTTEQAMALAHCFLQRGRVSVEDGQLLGFYPVQSSPLVTTVRGRALQFYVQVEEEEASDVHTGQGAASEDGFMSEADLQAVVQQSWDVWSREAKSRYLIGIDAALVQKLTEGDLFEANVELQTDGKAILSSSRVEDVTPIDEDVTSEDVTAAWQSLIREQGWVSVQDVKEELGPTLLKLSRDDLQEHAQALRADLEAHFSAETAAPGTVLSTKPSAGHSAAVAYIFHQLMGGDYVSATVEGNSHWYNRIRTKEGLVEVDLTGDQFGHDPVRVMPAGSMYFLPRTRNAEDLTPEDIRRAETLAEKAGLLQPLPELSGVTYG